MSCVFFLTTFLTAAFGLIINETAAHPPNSEKYKHMTAQFGVQSHDPTYKTSAPLVEVNPVSGCEYIENKEELNGTIALVKIGSCHFIEQAINVENAGGIGLVVGNTDNTMIWMTQPDSVSIHIPCVFVTRTTYDRALEKLNKQPAGSVIATISTVGMVPPPNLWTFPSLMEIVTYFLIVFPVVWAILAIKHFWWRNRQNRREQRRRRIRSQDIPEVLFTKDLLDPDSDVEVPIRRRTTHLTNNSCPICLENFEEQIKIKLLSCEHGFHSECIGPWIAEHNDSCPICRQTITVKEEDNELHSKCRCCCCQCPFWRVRRQEELNQSLLVLDAENEHQVAEIPVEEHLGLQEESTFQQEEEQKKGNLVSLQSFEDPVQADYVDVTIEEIKTGEVSR